MKRLFTLVLAILAALTMVACNRSGTGGDPNKPTVGISMSTLENPFFVSVKDAAVAHAEQLGLNALVADAQNDTQKQLNDVQDLITKGAKAIVLNPVEPESATPIVEFANSRNIPVVTVDRSSAGGDVASHVASDNVEGGRLICEWLGKNTGGNAQLAVLQGISGTSPELDRDKGCKEALSAFPGIKEVAAQPADWDREKGYTVMQNLLQANPGITAVFGRNDLAALGAVEALQRAGKLNQVTVISFDGIHDALESIKSGQLSATVVQDPVLMGNTAIDTADKLIKGESVDKIQNLPVKVADQANIDQFLN